jgi:hypothetical protein
MVTPPTYGHGGLLDKMRAAAHLLIVASLALGCGACLIARAECDQNTTCDGGQRCFQSSGTTSSGYCRDVCEDSSACPDVNLWVCGSCLSGGQDFCLDDGSGRVCRACTCDPRCAPGFGCVDGICVADAEGCTCRGLPCDALTPQDRPFCARDADCDDGERCALNWADQARGLCRPRCDQDADCPDPATWLCADCDAARCTSADPGKICRPCACSPACPEGSGCVDGVCVVGAEGCLCRGQLCPQ